MVVTTGAFLMPGLVIEYDDVVDSQAVAVKSELEMIAASHIGESLAGKLFPRLTRGCCRDRSQRSL